MSKYVILDLPCVIGPYKSIKAAQDARAGLFDEDDFIIASHPILELESEKDWISCAITAVEWTQEREKEFQKQKKTFRQLNPPSREFGDWWK